MRTFLLILLSCAFGSGNTCLAEGVENYSPSDVLQVEHVTTVENENSNQEETPVESGESEATSEEAEPDYGESTDNAVDSTDPPDPEIPTSSDAVEPGNVSGSGEDLSEDEAYSEPVQEEQQVSPSPGETQQRPVYYYQEQPRQESPPRPSLSASPEISKSRSQEEEQSLKELVRSLEYSSLENSIKILESMVRKYPYDPDYRSLLETARNLNKADVWYRYQRRLQLPPPSTRPNEIKKLIKMPRKEKPINALKQTTWFLLIKNNHPAVKN